MYVLVKVMEIILRSELQRRQNGQTKNSRLTLITAENTYFPLSNFQQMDVRSFVIIHISYDATKVDN